MPPRSHRSRAARARKIAVAVTGAIVLTPAAAHAATVGVVPTPGGPQIQFDAVAGEANAVTVTKLGNDYFISEAGSTPMGAAAGCAAFTSSVVRCTVTSLDSVRALLGDGDDSFDASALPVNAEAYGEAGNDTLQSPQTASFSVLDGGSGNDVLRPGAAVGDVLVGGSGVDTADYSSRTAAVTLDNDDGYSSGQLSEYDKISADVEALVGGSAGDTLRGGDGNESLSGLGGNDRIDGGAGDDTLDGMDGSDRLDGGTGADVVLGGAGDDVVMSRDSGTTDAVNCGANADSVTADRADLLDACEITDVPAAAPTPNPVTVDRPVDRPVDREVIVERERIVERITQLLAGAPAVVTIIQRELVFAPAKDSISVKLSCGAENKRGCAGDIVITTNVKAASKAKARSAKTAAPVVLAKSRFKLGSGEMRSVTAKISRRGVKQAFGGQNNADAKARGNRRIKATMSVSTKGSDGSVTKITKPVTVTIPGTSAR